MPDDPSDSELADMGDAESDFEDYRLAETSQVPPESRLPLDVEAAVRKAEEELKKAEEEARKSPPLRRFQFTIRDMLILTTVVAFLMGLAVSIARGYPVFWVYAIFFFAVIVVWFAVGLKKVGYWRPREIYKEDDLHDAAKKIRVVDPESQPLQYSAVNLFLLVSTFAFLLSLFSLLPGDHKLVNAAGITGLCTFIGLIWIVFSESRHPFCLILWWMVFLMYLLTSAAVIVVS